MNRPDITKDLFRRLEHHINPRNDPRIYTASEVTFDYSSNHAIRVDYMRFKPVNNSVSGIEKGDVYCYEIKSSAEDYCSGHGLNFVGDYNYLVMPESVFDTLRDRIPYFVGVLVPNMENGLKIVQKAKRHDRTRPLCEVLLMMYRSTQREVIKSRRAGEDGN